jgi:hypothetical protein
MAAAYYGTLRAVSKLLRYVSEADWMKNTCWTAS